GFAEQSNDRDFKKMLYNSIQHIFFVLLFYLKLHYYHLHKCNEIIHFAFLKRKRRAREIKFYKIAALFQKMFKSQKSIIKIQLKKKFDEGWDTFSFLTFRIFLLFEICAGLRQEEGNFIGLPRGTTFKQVYEKGIKELQ
ncbi:hypothetical protein RFI_38322, partial [Reticulomyxa filosa]